MDKIKEWNKETAIKWLDEVSGTVSHLNEMCKLVPEGNKAESLFHTIFVLDIRKLAEFANVEYRLEKSPENDDTLLYFNYKGCNFYGIYYEVE